MSESTWTPTPAAEPLSTMRTAVAGYVLMPTDTEVLDAALQGIRRAIDRLNARTWNWALTYFTITFVAGTQEYDLDQGFKQPRNLSLRNASGTDIDRLSYLPWGSFLKEANYESSGNPCYYSANNPHYFGTIHLDIVPSSSWVTTYPTGRLWYHMRVPYPVETGIAIGNVPSEVSLFILEQAQAYVADRYAVEKAQPAYMRAERTFNDLVRDDNHGQETDWR